MHCVPCTLQGPGVRIPPSARLMPAACSHQVPLVSGGCTPAAAVTLAAWRRTSASVASHCSAMVRPFLIGRKCLCFAGCHSHPQQCIPSKTRPPNLAPLLDPCVCWPTGEAECPALLPSACDATFCKLGGKVASSVKLAVSSRLTLAARTASVHSVAKKGGKSRLVHACIVQFDCME